MSWTKKAELGHDFELSYAICTRFLLQISEKFYKCRPKKHWSACLKWFTHVRRCSENQGLLGPISCLFIPNLKQKPSTYGITGLKIMT